MLNHTVYVEVLSKINRSFCTRLPGEEVKRQVIQLVNEINMRENLDMPHWEQQLLTRQLVHDLPNRDRLEASVYG